MNPSDGILNVQLVGGPFDGRNLEESAGSKVLAINVDELVPRRAAALRFTGARRQTVSQRRGEPSFYLRELLKAV